MRCLLKTSVIELKAVQKSSHVQRNKHAYGTKLWKRKNTGFVRCQSRESDKALMQQWKKTPEVRALKEMAVSTTPTTIANTSISNGLGILEFLSGNTYFITGATGFLAKGMALSSSGCFFFCDNHECMDQFACTSNNLMRTCFFPLVWFHLR